MIDIKIHKYLISKGITVEQANSLINHINVDSIRFLPTVRKDILMKLALRSKNPVHQTIAELYESTKKYKEQLQIILISIGFSQI